MTTDLEKQFFDTFGIEKQPVYSGSKLYNAFITGCEYPQITDRILLELICIWNSTCSYTEDVIAPIHYSTAELDVLEHFIDIDNYRFDIDKSIVKHQVQALFKEER